VTDPVHGHDVLRVLRVVHLRAEPRDVEVDRARDRELVVAPDLAQEALARHRAAALLDEEGEDLPLERGEARLLALALQAEAREVDGALAELEARGRGRLRLLFALVARALAADVRADARHELARAEGLR